MPLSLLDLSILTEELKDPKYAGFGAQRAYLHLFQTTGADNRLNAASVFTRAHTKALRIASGNGVMLPSDPDFPCALVGPAEFVHAWNASGQPPVQKLREPKHKKVACVTCFRVGCFQHFFVPADMEHPQGAPLCPAEWCRHCGTMIVEMTDGTVGVLVPNTASDIHETPFVKEEKQKRLNEFFDRVEGRTPPPPEPAPKRASEY